MVPFDSLADRLLLKAGPSGTSPVRRPVRQPSLRAPMRGAALDPSVTWSDEERRAAQWRRLSRALPELVLTNEFYRRKFVSAGIRDLRTVAALADLPLTTKAELSEDQA